MLFRSRQSAHLDSESTEAPREPPTRAPLPSSSGSLTGSSSLAGLLLLCVAMLLLATHLNPSDSSFIRLVRAFAEAALVGGIADWFAVTALFRRPAGLPIPHTAILPRNQARVAQGVSEFVADNFFSSSASPLGDDRAAAMVASALEQLSEEATRESVSRNICISLGFALRYLEHTDAGRRATHSLFEQLVRGTPTADTLADGIELLFRDPYQKRAVTEMLRLTQRGLHHNRISVINWIGRVAPWFIPSPITRSMASMVTTKVEELLQKMIAEENHPSRDALRNSLERMIQSLRADDTWRRQLDQLRDEILGNTNLATYSSSLSTAIIGLIQEDLSAPSSRIGIAVEEALAVSVVSLKEHPETQAEITSLVSEVSKTLFSPQRSMVKDTVYRIVMDWDSKTFVERIEGYVRRDLQYLRVNGTLVGGLVGIVLHLLLSR